MKGGETSIIPFIYLSSEGVDFTFIEKEMNKYAKRSTLWYSKNNKLNNLLKIE